MVSICLISLFRNLEVVFKICLQIINTWLFPGNQNDLELLYEHNLERSAANFVVGPFGNIVNRDFICVQSLDGMLSFFEQETPSFRSFLPDILLPGPIAYLQKTDCFITVCSNWSVVAYKWVFDSLILNCM